MRNVKLQMIAAVILACMAASAALACGLDFGWQLLDNRAATLDTMPINNTFAFAAARLAPSPKDALHAVEPEYSNEETAETLADAFTQAEDAGLSSTEAETLRQMRAETSGDQAYDKGELLPAAVRLYTAGAVDFHKGDASKAISRFQKILDLPANDRRDRAVWAAYMLGRLYAGKGMFAKASKSFALTRELANDGAPDPLGLGVASYGEEARLHLDRARELQKLKKKSAIQREKYGHEIASAVALYASQSAHGSKFGIDSLRIVADEALGDDAAIEASICDPIVQQLLVDRILANYAAPPELSGDSGSSGNSQLSQVASASQKCGDDHLTDADQLAAIAYRSGDYQLAHRLAIQTTTPLAMWVQARLAMQKGDVAEAAKYYAAASKAFPSSDTNASAEAVKALLIAQNGVLTLSRGEYVDSLEQLYPYAGTFWGDVTHIAERVLTVDELKTFVDTHKDTQVQPVVSLANLPSPFGFEASDGGPPDSLTQFWFPDGRSPADHLRDLLARRLVRAGRYQEALGYAPPLEVPNSAAATSSPAAAPTVSIPTVATFGSFADSNSIKPKGRSGYRAQSGISMRLEVPNSAAATSSLAAAPKVPPPSVRAFPLVPFVVPAQIEVSQTQAQIIPKGEVVAEPKRNKDPYRQLVLAEPPEDAIAEYVQALNDASTARSDVDRARGLYRAAALAGNFKSGNKIMGTEAPPDNYGQPSVGGGTGQFELHADDRLVTDGERQRFKASAPKPNFRYHYIFVGTDEAIRAADLLSPRSQAFAAVLCNATSWMIDGKMCPASASSLRDATAAYGSNTPSIADPLTVEALWPDEDDARINLTCQLYQRYLKAGAVVPWATRFGRDCPEPDFDSAAQFVQAQTIREARRHTQIIRHRWNVLLKLALVAVVLATSTVWFLRHRYAATHAQP
jgi:hypothetical protein